MPFVEWRECFQTGIQQFDDDHQQLVGILNNAFDDFMSGAPDSNVGITLNNLVEYAGRHFAAEEIWMREKSYPRLVEHKQEHDKLSRRLSELQEAFYRGDAHISLDVLTFLKKWFRKHLLESDAGYSHYMCLSGSTDI